VLILPRRLRRTAVQRAVARVAALDDVFGEPVTLRVLGSGAGGDR
jgi:hypothetical protein